MCKLYLFLARTSICLFSDFVCFFYFVPLFMTREAGSVHADHAGRAQSPVYGAADRRQAESRPFEPDDIKNGRQGLLLAAV